MGATVKAVVGIVAMAAIAVAAPYLAPMALGALGIVGATATAIATAVIATTLSIGVALAFRAIGVGPVTAWGGGPAPLPPCDLMEPISPSWLYRIAAWQQGHWHRFSVHRLDGNCMNGVKNGSWALIDRRATIRRGDLFAFRLTTWGAELFTIGRVKRFLGCNPAAGSFDWQMDNPKQHHCDRLEDTDWAFRVRYAGTFLGALRARWQILRDSSSHDERLARALSANGARCRANA